MLTFAQRPISFTYGSEMFYANKADFHWVVLSSRGVGFHREQA